MTSDIRVLRRRIKYLLWFFVIALVLSGVTAFPLKWGTDILQRTIGDGTFMESQWPAMAHWISRVHEGIAQTHQKYAFVFYGTDWLAFAHIVIAIAFIGPICDPVKNIWVVKFGMIACVLVIPLALICGPIRGIPFFWRLIDCSFSIGIVPLWFAHRYIWRVIDVQQERTGT